MFPAKSINPSSARIRKTSSCTQAVSQTSADTLAFIRQRYLRKMKCLGPKEPVTQTRPGVCWKHTAAHRVSSSGSTKAKMKSGFKTIRASPPPFQEDHAEFSTQTDAGVSNRDVEQWPEVSH